MEPTKIEKIAAVLALESGAVGIVYYGVMLIKTVKEIKELDKKL